jgi:hypothetical protein
MNSLRYIHRRPFIACLALTLAILGSSFGVAKSASAAAPERPAAVAALSVRAPTPTADHRAETAAHAAVPTLRHHLAHLEVESGEVRHPLETLNLATARPARPEHAERPI